MLSEMAHTDNFGMLTRCVQSPNGGLQGIAENILTAVLPKLGDFFNQQNPHENQIMEDGFMLLVLQLLTSTDTNLQSAVGKFLFVVEPLEGMFPSSYFP